MNCSEDFSDRLSALSGARVLVTGGAGFIGSNVVEGVHRVGASVTVLDDLSTGSLLKLAGITPYRFVHGSVTDRALVDHLVSETDFVVHLAARNIVVSVDNPRDDFETNIGGTLNVLLAAREHKVRRVAYASSASIYGNPRCLPIVEDEPPRTFSPYAVSKLAGENYCLAFYETYRVPVTALRYSNVYGAQQTVDNPYCGVVARFIAAIARNEQVPVHGDGQQTRDFTYVSDIVEATLMALLSPRAEGFVFNVGTGIETSVLHLASSIADTLNRRLRVEHIDRRDIDNIRRRVMNIERIRTCLRWEPRIALSSGICRTLEWLKLGAAQRPVPEDARPSPV